MSTTTQASSVTMSAASEFGFDVLLFCPSDSAIDGPSGSAYKYLTRLYYYDDHETSQGASVSDLKAVIGNAQDHMIPDLDMEIEIYEFDETLGPATEKVLKERYKDFNLKDRAIRWHSDKRLAHIMNPENLFAVLYSVQEASAQIRREDIAIAARNREPPSTGATAASRTDTQKKTVDALYNYRPIDLTPPPITIYHPVFAKFLQMMAVPDVFTHEELDHAHRFVTQAVAYCKLKADRVDNLSEMSVAVHPHILSRKVLSYASGRLEPDGVVFSAKAPNGFTTVAAMTEAKVEVGEGGCDPLAQAECAYVAVYSSAQARLVRDASCCPAFIIGMAGPNIIVSGAVFADQLIAQTLTDYISVVPRPGLDNRSPLDNAGYRVATLFRALKVCIKELETFYSDLVKEIWPAPASAGGSRSRRVHSIISPHFKKYCDSEGQEVVLTYKESVLPGDVSTNAVFVAEARSKSEIAKVVVKFAYAYNRDAHELLADDSLAPKLRYCNYEPDVAMWIVLMDYVDGEEVPLDHLLMAPAHVKSLRAAITRLHDNEWVFGDLRRPNVLVVQDGVVLIDFDWCGKAGVARYPSDILMDDPRLGWHHEVQRGGLIDKEHDAHCFYRLTGQKL